MLPNMFVIGAPRSGTTSLYEYLDAHPEVVMGAVKEPDFFADPALVEVNPLASAPIEGSIQDDAVGHGTLLEKLGDYERLWAHASDEPIRGEASAVYLGDPFAAWHLRRYVPDARFVVILRDPVERAHSHFVHAMRLYTEHGRATPEGLEDLTPERAFEQAIDAALADGMPAMPTNDPEVWVRAGFYHAHLTRWFELFPRERFAIFRFEELAADPRAVMQSVYRHLGVDDTFRLPTTEAFNATVVPRNARLFKAFTTTNPIMKRAKALAPTRLRGLAVRSRNRLLGNHKPEIGSGRDVKLRRIYHDDTRELQRLLDVDLTAWLRTEGG